MIEKISTEIEDIDDNDAFGKLKKQAIGELIITKFTDCPWFCVAIWGLIVSR